MKCYVHEDEVAVGICKNCFKAICKQCAIPNDLGFMACSEECKQELIVMQKMSEKAKLAYGLKPGKMLPATVIFMVISGLLFSIFGCFILNTSLYLGLFLLMTGTVFLVVGGIFYYNQRKIGIQS